MVSSILIPQKHSFVISLLFYFFAGLKLLNVKKNIVVIISIFLLLACTNKKDETNKGLPSIKFSSTEFDFGTIQMGEMVTCDFAYENTGNGDLIITKVDSDCGCTIANFATKAIKPGEKSSIEAIFDSNGLPGFQIKKITVHSNAGKPVILTVSAVVDFELNSNTLN